MTYFSDDKGFLKSLHVDSDNKIQYDFELLPTARNGEYMEAAIDNTKHNVLASIDLSADTSENYYEEGYCF